MKKDSFNIKSEAKVFIAADKTSNYYKTEPEDYLKLLENNITKNYKKTDDKKVKEVNDQDIKITEELDIDDRVFKTTKRQAFVTIKDHKENFRTNTKCRLLNPTKPELGKISKKLTENINCIVRMKTGFNQFKNSDCFIKWYCRQRQKHKLSFIQLDVDDMYGSITKELLEDAIEWAQQYVYISDEDKEIIFQAKKSLIYNDDEPWNKKGTLGFDVTMGSFDGAETCDLIGLFLLSQLQDLGIDIGIFRDDGIAVSKFSPQKTENIKKKICAIFKKNKLSITIVANLKVVNFLDITCDLNLGTYGPYTKPNDKPLYVNKKSNHPAPILKNIPEALNNRLSKISSNEEIFMKAAPKYQEELIKCGYDYKLKYNPQINNSKSKNRSRKRNISWFNPSFSLNVSKNVAACFLKFIDDSFPEDHPLRKIFNRNTVKVRYKTTPNMKQTITSHNTNILNTVKKNNNNKTCLPIK